MNKTEFLLVIAFLTLTIIIVTIINALATNNRYEYLEKIIKELDLQIFDLKKYITKLESEINKSKIDNNEIRIMIQEQRNINKKINEIIINDENKKNNVIKIKKKPK